MKKTKKKKRNWKSLLGSTIYLLICFCIGMGMGRFLSANKTPNKDVGSILFIFFFSIFIFYLSCLLQMIVHEAGHLVCGLLTGYQFSSFRIGSFMWIKDNDKLRLKRYSLAGTGGQCLMSPPDLQDDKIPYVLYNLGGCLANLLLSVICLLLFLFFREYRYTALFLIICAIVGLLFALLNGIPIRDISNDGYNALNLGKDKEALRAFWIQLKTNQQYSLGKHLKDLPEEWFTLPPEDKLDNSIIATIAVFRCNYLMDQGKYEEADSLMEDLLQKKTGMVGIHRHLLINDRIFCKIISENSKEQIDELLTKEQMNFMKSMKTNPSILRTGYLYTKYIKKDESLANKAMAAFEKTAARYPYPQDIESEREMIVYATEKKETSNE
ncbi:MAG: hypothetical protein IKK33_13860 [Lachnospiraceae bacterium]|nr:hypothetical protein [Lachnospiraceae bacterium]